MFLLEVDFVLLAGFTIKLAILTPILLFLFSISVNLMIAGHNLVGLDTSVLGEYSMNTILAILFSIYILRTSPAMGKIESGAAGWLEWTAAWLEGTLARLRKSIAPSVHNKLLDKYSRAKKANDKLASIGAGFEARCIKAERSLSGVQRERERQAKLANELEERLEICQNQMGIKDEVIGEMAQRIGFKNSQIEAESERYIKAKEELGRERRTVQRLQKQLDQVPGVRILGAEANAVAAAEVATSQLQSMLDAIGVADVAGALAKMSDDKAAAKLKAATLETTRADLGSLLDAVGTRDVGRAVGMIAEGKWAASANKAVELREALSAAEAVASDVGVVLEKLGVENVAQMWQKLVDFDADFANNQAELQATKGELKETREHLASALATLDHAYHAAQASQGVVAPEEGRKDSGEASQGVAMADEPHEGAGEASQGVAPPDEPREDAGVGKSMPMDVARKLSTLCQGIC
jgi:hypothetical protein